MKRLSEYAPLAFLVLSFTVTFFILKDVMAEFIAPTFSLIVSALIGVLVGLIFFYVLRRLSILIRSTILIVYLVLLSIGYRLLDSAYIENEEKSYSSDLEEVEERNNLLDGIWSGSEESVSVDFVFEGDTLTMIYYPDTVVQVYTYLQLDGSLELEGVNVEDEMYWEYEILDEGNTLKINSDDYAFSLKRTQK